MMPIATIQAPDGKTLKIEVPDGATQDQILEFVSSNYKPETPQPEAPKRTGPMRWAEANREAIKNLPESAFNVVKNTAGAVLHPIDTAQTALNMGNAALQRVLPESVNQVMHKVAEYVPGSNATAEESPKSDKNLQGAMDFYKNRYGSLEGFKEAWSKDPAGIMADASTVLSLGGSAASKIPQIAKAGERVSDLARMVDPMSVASKAGGAFGGVLGNRLADVVGMTTGAGSAAVKKAFEAGKVGGDKAEAFVRNLRGDADISDVVGDAQSALESMRKARSVRYQQGMNGIRADQTVLDFAPVEDAMIQALDVSNYKGKAINRSAAGVQQKISDILKEWGESDPAEFHTAEGFDALKRTIGDVRDSTEARTPSRVVADRVYNAVKGQIVEQAPEYAGVMKDYENASRLTKEIERALSLGEKASADTAVRKLQSLTRNNVSTNYGNRMKLADELEQSGSPNLMTKLSGQALNSWTPRGLQGATGGGATLYGMATGNPSVIAALPFTSPRLMGEASHLVGKAAQGYDELKPYLDSLDSRQLANYLYQMDQPKKEAQ
jgi:hypothetical protein